jgi:predicted permease
MFRQRPQEDFAREVDSHIAIETDRLIAEGMSPESARAAAMKAFGNVTRVKERYFEASRWAWLEQVRRDAGYALRALSHSPSFAVTAVVTLALGIGLITVAFTVVNAYVLRPYAIRNPDSLHKIIWRSQQDAGPSFRWREFESLRDRSDLFEGIVAESERYLTMRDGRVVRAALVSGDYFDVLGPTIALGRALGTADGAGGDGVVLSDQAWRRLFQADPGVLGRALTFDRQHATVVGVAAPEFSGISDQGMDLWMPFTTYAAAFSPALIGPDQQPSVQIFARLRGHVTTSQAAAALAGFVAASAGVQESVRAELMPQRTPNPLSIELIVILAPVFATFGLVLATACANVSNVMLARAMSRQREIAVRLSLGASRGRIVRQLLTEGVVIAACAGVGGLAIAYWTLRAGSTLVMGTLPTSVASLIRFAPTPFDHRVFLFVAFAAALATLTFAPLPSFQASRLKPADALRGGQSQGSRRGSRLRGALITGQVAISLVLIVFALTIGRVTATIGGIDPGYDTRGAISINVRNDDPGLIAKLAAVLETDPRVAELAVAGGNPMFVRERDVAATPGHGRSATPTRYTFVSPEYFSVLRIALSQGRTFTAREADTGAAVAIVSAATANAFWPGADPLGQTITFPKPEAGERGSGELRHTLVTVIGVVPDVVSGLLMDGPDGGHIYLPATARRPEVWSLLVRARSNGDLNAAALQELFRRTGPNPDVFEALPLDELRALQMYPLQMASWVGIFLAALALILSVTGLYGVLSYLLSQRTREIGIRMALGATARNVTNLVLAQSLRLSALGLVLGALVAFAGLRALSSAIEFRTAPLLGVDVFAASLLFVVASALVAAWHPAHRAARVDPAQTLRSD